MARLNLLLIIILAATICIYSCDDDPADGENDSTNGEADDDDDVADDDITDDDNDDSADDDDNYDDDDDDTTACWDDLGVGEKVAFATGFSGTEGIAINKQGELFVATAGGVAKVQPDGNWNVIATGIIDPVGIAFDADEVLYIADYGDSSLAAPNDGGVYKLTVDDDFELLAAGIPNPNFIAYTPWGDLLVSDNTTDTIYNITGDGTVTEWFAPIGSPNGMVFSQGRDALFVADTYTLNAPIYRIDLDASNKPTGSQTIANLDNLGIPDGMAMDENGMLLVLENAFGRLVRLDPLTGNYELIVKGMFTPASLAFGRGINFDPCSVYITELIGSRVWRVPVGTRGYPLVSDE